MGIFIRVGYQLVVVNIQYFHAGLPRQPNLYIREVLLDLAFYYPGDRNLF